MNNPIEEEIMEPRNKGQFWSHEISYVTDDNRPRGPNIMGSSTGHRPTSNERPKQHTNATRRGDSVIWCHAYQGRSQPSDSNGRKNPEPISEGNDAQAGHSWDATSLATAFEHLNRTFETFLTRLSRSLWETFFHLPWQWVQAIKQKPRKRRRTMTNKMTSNLNQASIVRLRIMMHTPIERLALWTDLMWSGQ